MSLENRRGPADEYALSGQIGVGETRMPLVKGRVLLRDPENPQLFRPTSTTTYGVNEWSRFISESPYVSDEFSITYFTDDETKKLVGWEIFLLPVIPRRSMQNFMDYVNEFPPDKRSEAAKVPIQMQPQLTLSTVNGVRISPDDFYKVLGGQSLEQAMVQSRGERSFDYAVGAFEGGEAIQSPHKLVLNWTQFEPGEIVMYLNNLATGGHEINKEDLHGVIDMHLEIEPPTRSPAPPMMGNPLGNL